MPKNIKWLNNESEATIAAAIEVLNNGGLVVFPSDTAYIAACAANNAAAVERLQQPANAEQSRLTIGVSGIAGTLPWISDMPMIGRRLAGRCWPGPLTLVFPIQASSIDSEVPEQTRRRVCFNDTIALRCPCHEAIYNVLLNYPDPVVFRELTNESGELITAEDEAEKLDAFELVITEGATYFEMPASVVEVQGSNWKLTQTGAVAEEDLQRLTRCQIVFVCTGNTCRSPMAEALCKKLLADHFKCSAEELPQHGYFVESAGITAQSEERPSPEAVEAVQELGGDLSNHVSQPMTVELLNQADFILAMTNSHLQVLSGHGINRVSPPTLLSLEGCDVSDPIGGEGEVYRQCARQIQEQLQKRLPEFLQATT